MDNHMLKSFFFEALGEASNLSDNPTKYADYFTNQLCELVGAKCVFIAIQKEKNLTPLLSVYPSSKIDWLNQMPVQEFIDFSHINNEIQYWDKKHENTVVENLLNSLSIENVIAIPLILTGNTIGSVMLLNITKKNNIDELMKLTSKLAGVLALIIKNSILSDDLEKAIQTKTSELQNRNEELEEKDFRFQQILQNAPIPFIIHAENGEVMQINYAWTEITGYELKEIPTTFAWTELAYPEDKLSVDKDIEELYGINEKYYNGEYPILTKTGNQRIWDFISAPLGKLADGRRMVISMATDITERKQSEKLLLESETKYRTLVMNSPDAIAIYTPKEIVFVNNECLRLMGATSEIQLLGRHPMELVHPDSREFVAARMKQALLNKQFLPLAEEKFIRLDGSVCDVDVKAIPITFEGQAAVQIIVRDITERKVSEATLKHERELYLDLVNAQPAGIYRIRVFSTEKWVEDAWSNSANSPYIVELASDRFCEILGVSRTEFENNPKVIDDLIHPDDQVEYEIRNKEANIKQIPFSWDCRLIIKGEVKWVHFESLPRKLENGDIIFTGILYDIGERKIAEIKLHENYNLLSNLTAQVPGVVYQYRLYPDGSSAFPYSSDGMYEIYEVTPDEVREDASPVFTRIHPNDYDFIVETITESARSQTVYSSEFRVILPEQGLRWRHCDAKPELLDDGSTLWHGVINDITDRKKAEETIRKSKERLNRAELASKSGNWELFVESGIIKASKGAAIVYGLEREEFSLKNIQKIPLDDYRPMIDLSLKNLIEKGEPYNIEFKIKTADSGEVKDIHSSAVYDKARNVIFGIIRDITEQKKADKALLESEQKLSMLFESMNEMVVMHELVLDDMTNAINYRILDCNDAFTIITGIRREDAIGKLATEVFQMPEAPYIHEYANVVITGESYEFDSYYEPMDKHFIISAVSIGENMFATIATDISEIQNAQKELKEKNQELENYIYVASHDLRSPLVNIQGFSQRLEKQTEKLNLIIAEGHLDEIKKQEIQKITHEDVPKSLNFILNNVAKMDSLIGGLLHLSRTGRIVLTVKNVDMNKLVNDVIESFNFELTECNANLKIDYLTDCYGDENQLNQVLSNIIGNAIKYRDKNRKLEIEITSKEEMKRVRYSVKDNGIGINERQLQKIWDIFYRVDASSPEAGEGLGLSLARRIIEKHKGKIWAESEINVGSVFHIELQRNLFEL
jgi:PAS domain S-box-containing protein